MTTPRWQNDVMETLGVTGATGAIGGRTAQILAEAGLEQRLLVRSPERAPHLTGTTAVPFEYGREDLVVPALQGVDVLLFVSAHEGPDRLAEHRTVIDAAAAAGVRHIVHTSYVSAAPDAVFTLARDHFATEQMLAGSGLATTILRDNMYIDFAEHLAGPDGVIRGPAGDGRAAMVARADLAEVAAAVMRRCDEFAGRTLQMTGPEALGLGPVAELLTRATGRPISYHDETVEEAYRSREVYGAPDWEVDAWVSTYLAMAAGQLDEVSDDVAAVLGREPLSLSAFLGLS